MEKNRTALVSTAIHVLKGAIVKELHLPVTTTKTFSTKTAGRLAVEYEGPKVGDDVVKRIEAAANEKIQQNVPIQQFTLPRAEAEARFRASPVNGTYIYDKIAPPATLTELSIVLIDDWTVNCSPGDHLAKTGDVGYLHILRINQRNTDKKKELEFCFEVLDEAPADAAGPAASKGKGKGKPKEDAPTGPSAKQVQAEAGDVFKVSANLMNDFFRELYASLEPAQQELVKKKEKEVRERLEPTVETQLVLLRNASYASGYNSHVTPTYFS
eukprot:TRINITY_DN2567_c0_g1_i2.p2 TRINITY_DN2567_c0_g1~~TRINITY_DN2567_c0_g1_i2.p2  ORF type:complete len:270 (-),score=59.93 TRINITY_DN2567_c0_g1_i2:1019-1828(-)